MLNKFRILMIFVGTCVAFKLPAAVYLEPTPQFKPHFEISALYIEDGDRILILHRQPNKSQGNRWGIPAGKIDKGETPLQAAIREAKEETGFDFTDYPVQPLTTVYCEYNEKLHFAYHTFRVKMPFDPGSVKINFEEHKGFTWVTLEEGLQYPLIEDEDTCFKMRLNCNP